MRQSVFLVWDFYVDFDFLELWKKVVVCFVREGNDEQQTSLA
jgi:hypothetical protein